MHRYPFILGALLSICLGAGAQQNNIWHFGRGASLDFNNVAGQPLPHALANSAIDASEGTSSICDSDGNLLFYSDGLTVYNRLHQVMLNGANLLGNASSVQSSIIVPVPGNDLAFYIFTTDAIENNFANGYRYSTIDMSLDGGNGGVTSKNIMLSASCTERMVAARHANGIDIWVITNDNNSNVFRAWLINCSGLQTTPVVSNVGVVMDQHVLMNTGMMKVSPDGKQLCQTHFAEIDVTFNPNFCQLFDFNNLTGTLSNPRSVSFSNSQFIACEYSPDSKLLYLTVPVSKTIDQIECGLATAAAIQASRVRINTGNSAYYGIQLAPDEKIYLAYQSDRLGVINKPNVKGTGCNYVEDHLPLFPGTSALGLPAFINDLSSNLNNGFSYTIIDSCTGKIQFNGFTTMSGTISWQWNFGDGNTSSLQNPQHTYLLPTQDYTVKLKIVSASGCGFIEKSKTIMPAGIIVEPDFDFIAKCDSGYVRFTNLSKVFPDTSAALLNWDFGDGNFSSQPNPIHPFTAGGIYDVKLSLITSTPCLNRSITKTLNLEILDIQAPPDMIVEAGETVQLYVTGGGSHFTWTPSTGISDTSISNPTALPTKNIMYKVTVTNDAGCVDSDSVYIKINPFPGIYVPTGFTPNNDGKNDVFRPILTKEFTLQEFSIYNRWGQLVFTTSQKEKGWNGKINGMEQNTGVYIWIVNATDTRNGEKHRKKGTFVILH